MADAQVEVEIINKLGFHVRPSTAFSQLAQKFAATITVSCGAQEADGKQIMALIGLGVTAGSMITISATGEDAAAAVAALEDLVKSSFGGIE